MSDPLLERAKKDAGMVDEISEPTEVERRLAATIVELINALEEPKVERYEAIKQKVSDALPDDIPDHVYDAITDPLYDWIFEDKDGG